MIFLEMKKSLTILLGLILISVGFVGLVSGGVWINEVMADPARCSDTDCEYIEIYTDSAINLTNCANHDSEPLYFSSFLFLAKISSIIFTAKNEPIVIVNGSIFLLFI